MPTWGVDQYGDPILDDLVLLPDWDYLSEQDIETILHTDWYERGNTTWWVPPLISYSVLDPLGLDAETKIGHGYVPGKMKLFKVEAILHRWNHLDGWYHA